MFGVYDLPLFRPPSEAKSLIIQATIGCSHNKCTFCGMYKMKKFRIKSFEEIKSDIDFLKNFYGDVERVFIADGNALCMDTEDLLRILRYLKRVFPSLKRVSIYATPMDILDKSLDDLKALRSEGLSLIYLGIESGDDQVLREVRKGATSDEIIKAGKKAIKAGMILSTTAILGLGGKERSYEHAVGTARVLNEIKPHYTAFLTLIIVEKTPLHAKILRGEFKPLNQIELLNELKIIVEMLNYKTVFRANHASNYLPIKGDLPEDKERIIELIEYAIRHPEILRPDHVRGL